MIEITRAFEFDYGHRLMNHEGHCKNLHGHRGRLEVTVYSKTGLDEQGRVVDFGELKRSFGEFIANYWDHAFLAQEGDPIVEFLALHQLKAVLLPGAPTAENIARHMAEAGQKFLAVWGLTVVRVRFYETPNCYAEWTP